MAAAIAQWGLLALLALAVTLLGAAMASAAGNSITAPDTAGSVGDHTSLALDDSGNPVVSYRDNTNGDLRLLHCNDANCARGDESITSPDTVGSVGDYSSLALDDSGNPVVSYFDEGNRDLKVLHCNDVNCAGGDESVVAPDSVGEVGAWTSLALDTLGNPVVSYYDYTNGALKVLHCNDADCSGGGDSITTPDNVADVGYWTSLALDGGGNPVVSYFDQTNLKLKLLHCNDANCAGGGESITTPDAAGAVGWYSSLALDAAGNPVISYFDGTNNDLKVLHCNDVNCSGGGESSTTPDMAPEVGVHTSLTLDASGNPVVSYFDNPNLDLKMLHCSDPNCTGVKPTPPPTNTLMPTATNTFTPVPTIEQVTFTPTPRATPPVGGIALDPQFPGSSRGDAGLLAGVIAGAMAGAIALGGAVWYARRRRNQYGGSSTAT